MIRRLPLIPSLIVAAAVAVMIALGVWQLRREVEKEALLDRFRAAQNMPPISYPTGAMRQDQLPLFRHATGMCLQPVAKRSTAGRNRAGETGYSQIVDCRTGAEGPGMSVEIGWSKDPGVKVNWPGGLVSGIIVPDRRSRIRLVAASAPPGLQTSAPPPPTSSISPARHRGYAATWFSLAAVALIIYGLAVRKRLREERPKA